MPPKRYFDDERSAKPGLLSDELRAALDLHRDKLPMWIYKMRILGYPPGWLQQADISTSSLQLFDDSNQAQQSTSQSRSLEEQAFNPEFFVEFPGFNAPVPRGVRDHCEILGMPPMQGFQQLNFVKKTIPPPKPVPYKRIKFSYKNDTDQKNGTLTIDDDDDEIQIIEPKPIRTIDIRDEEKEEGEASDSDDDVIPIVGSSEESKVQNNPTILKSSTIIEEIPSSQSPSKDDSVILLTPNKPKTNPPTEESPVELENQKIENHNSSEPEKNSKENSTVAESVTTSTELNENQQVDDKQLTQEAMNSSTSSLSCSIATSTSSVESKSPSIKLIGMGCPLPADVDSKKPPLEKFAAGMGELIYFENLPTSTGVFDKMRNVISMVRKKLSE